MNRGIEIAGAVLEDLAASRVLVTQQVSHGVAARMAVLFRLIGSGTALPHADGPPDAAPSEAELTGGGGV